jgi:hypothetical protein
MTRIGTNACHWQNFPITIVIKQVLRWLRSKHYTSGERKIFGPDLVTEAEEKVKTIQNNLKAAQSQQKSYANI